MADRKDPYQEPFDGDEDDDLIELVDENGETTTFEHMSTFEYNGVTYLAVCDPEAAEAESENLEVLLLRVESDKEGNDFYIPADDGETDEAFSYFLSMLEDGFRQDADSDGN